MSMISVDAKKCCCGTCQHWSGERVIEARMNPRVKCATAYFPCKVIPIKCQAPHTCHKKMWKPWVELP